MLDGPIDLIDEASLTRLIDDQVSESRHLEFKRDLPGQDSDSVREFLADVSSLANAHGGDLVFGIEEANGIAAGLPGVDIADPDAEILRLESSIRSGIAPRLAGIRMHFTQLVNGRGVLIIRVPRGLMPPHRITYRNSGKFYSRTSRGKYELDVHELRHAFLETSQLPSRFRQLHQEAIERARGIDMPFAIMAEPTAVVSTIPLSHFREDREIPISRDTALVPIRPDAYSSIEMLEGVLLHTPIDRETGRVRSFALTYRDGRTDVAWTIGGKRRAQNGEELRLIWPDSFENGLIDATRGTQSRLQPFGIEGPWVVMVSIFGSKDHFIHLDWLNQSNPAFRNEALIGQIQLERIEVDDLLPLAQRLWLIFGMHRPEQRPFGQVL